MRRNILFLSAVCILGFSSPAPAKTKRAPLPEEILQAKTAYIDNRSGVPYIAEKANDELSKWGRFKIAKSASDADVVLLFSADEYVSGHPTDTNGATQGAPDDSGNAAPNSDSTSGRKAKTGGVTFLTVVDPKTGAALWSEQEPWDHASSKPGLAFPTGVPRALVRKLRDRITEQEAENRRKGK
jgi:hypothetical protein